MKKDLETNIDFNSDQYLEVFDELPFWAAPFGIKLLDNIKIKKGINALDIGFGAGFPLIEMASRLGNSSIIYGIDPWKAAINRTRKKIDFYGFENIKIIEGVAENIPLEDSYIDLIVSNNGMNNVADLDKSLSECSRILKTGGQFLLTMNLNSTMIEFYEILENILTNKGMHTEIEKMKEQIYIKRKPLEEFLNRLEQHGFTVTNVIKDQFDYKFADGTTMLNHHLIRPIFLKGWKSIVLTDKQVEIFEEIEKEMNILSEKDGYFKLSVPFVLIDCTKR